MLGNVYEPYLSLTTHLDIFADRLLDGFTLAESAWAAHARLVVDEHGRGRPALPPGLVWKNLDSDLDADPRAEQPALATEGRAYWQGAQLWRARGPAAGAAALEKSAARLHSGRIYEGLGVAGSRAGDVPHARTRSRRRRSVTRTLPTRCAWLTRRCVASLSRAGKQTRRPVLAATRDQYASDPAAAVLDELKRRSSLRSGSPARLDPAWG